MIGFFLPGRVFLWSISRCSSWLNKRPLLHCRICAKIWRRNVFHWWGGDLYVTRSFTAVTYVLLPPAGFLVIGGEIQESLILSASMRKESSMPQCTIPDPMSFKDEDQRSSCVHDDDPEGMSCSRLPSTVDMLRT